jgi:group I intron endonuclease
VNNINHKTYIGSSVNFSVRLYKYFSLKNLAKSKTPIHNALLKYGLENFSLEILEYCEQDVNPVLREQHYFDLLGSPYYNILEKAGSLLGFKHSKDTFEKFVNREVSEETRKNLSVAATGRILTEQDKKKISLNRKGIKLSDDTRSKIALAAANLRGVKVKVTNIITNEEFEFNTLTDAAQKLEVSRTSIKKALDNKKLIKGQYKIT